MKTQSFKGKEFQVVRGTTHPEYSYHTFEREEHELRNKYWNIRPREVVFDVGASYGSYTLTALSQGAFVFAFEPERSVYVDLLKNIELNNWNTRCHTFDLALSDVGGTLVDMRQYAPHWPSQSITSEYRTQTLDRIVDNYNIGRLDWIKIDVEGLEEKVLKGAWKSIETFHPRLLIECHDFMDANISKRVKGTLPQYRFEEITREPCITLLGI